MQRDTYFAATRGRLKLREEPAAVAQLIAYERPDLAGQKESRYRLVDAPEPDALREALASAFGITAVVSKERRLFIHRGVRIHLDRVDGLGEFIEFEGVVPEDGNADGFAALLDELGDAFGIRPEDLVRASYADLIRDAS